MAAGRARGSGRQSQRATISWGGLRGGCSRALALLLEEPACSGSRTGGGGTQTAAQDLVLPTPLRLALALSPLGGCSPHPRYGLCRGTRPPARCGALGEDPPPPQPHTTWAVGQSPEDLGHLHPQSAFQWLRVAEDQDRGHRASVSLCRLRSPPSSCHRDALCG